MPYLCMCAYKQMCYCTWDSELSALNCPNQSKRRHLQCAITNKAMDSIEYPIIEKLNIAESKGIGSEAVSSGTSREMDSNNMEVWVDGMKIPSHNNSVLKFPGARRNRYDV
ncbi:hypothetical protein CEXT_524821 [Caerostris extrusa]|uniref:Uncharacterized protein n=1 Tax=Caerostris extrusa TaxID=172846 RepID=A0AAV4XP05_CAEEX|nr:hypothetical protein CEXT_524821 [Caerostris extrusa]